MENTMISLGFLRWLPGLSTHARKLGLLAILACLSTPAAAQIEIPLYSFTGGADGGR